MQVNAEHYVIPTEELINNLGPGCYVQVERQGDNVWVEIDDVINFGFIGTVHRELSGNNSNASKEHVQIAFHPSEITLLGCNRYCFC